MLIVLDSNEYLFFFGADIRPSCEALLKEIIAKPEQYRPRISSTILEEVRRNLSPQRFKSFWNFLNALGVSVDESWEVPFELGAKYEAVGGLPMGSQHGPRRQDALAFLFFVIFSLA